MQPPALYALIACVGLFTSLCTFWDVRWMKMPNKFTVPAFFAGLVFHFARGVWEHGTLAGGLYEFFWWSVCGFAVGFAILFLSFAMGTVGGGDVKFMSAVGAWVGPQWLLIVFIATAVYIVVFGAIAFVQGVARNGFRKTMHHYMAPFRRRKKGQPAAQQRLRVYAVPFTCAVWTLFGLVLFSEYSGTHFKFLSPNSAAAPAASADSAVPRVHSVPS